LATQLLGELRAFDARGAEQHGFLATLRTRPPQLALDVLLGNRGALHLARGERLLEGAVGDRLVGEALEGLLPHPEQAHGERNVEE
jgi:hypothetical protein